MILLCNLKLFVYLYVIKGYGQYTTPIILKGTGAEVTSRQHPEIKV